MNKLLVSDILNINNEECLLEINNDNIKLIIDGNVIVHLINQVFEYLDIEIKDNSSLTLYKYNRLKEHNGLINIIQNNNSSIFYNESIFNENNNKVVINNYINGNDNESNIKIRNICNKENSEIIINVYAKKNTNNNIALEDLKGINNGGFIHIEPNIICESNEVVANHLTTIGSVSQTILNYLMSKGIEENRAKELILKSFEFSNMSEYIKNNCGGE